MTNNSNYAKKFFLVDPALFQRIRLNQAELAGDLPADLKLKKWVSDFASTKEFDRNVKNEALKTLSDDISPLITQSIKNGVTPTTVSLGGNPPNSVNTQSNVNLPTTSKTTPSLNASLSSSQTPSNKTEDIVDLIEKKISKSYRNKAIKLFYLLSSLPGVKISTSDIEIGTMRVTGSTIGVLDTLVKKESYLRFPVTVLLDKLIENGKSDEILSFKLIQNKEAISYLEENAIEPAALSSFQTALESNDDFNDPIDSDDVTVTGDKGSGKQKRVRWRVLIKGKGRTQKKSKKQMNKKGVKKRKKTKQRKTKY